MIKFLKKRWGIESNANFWLIFSIFGITGTSMLFLKPSVFDYLGIDHSISTIWYVILYILTVTPMYFAVLLVFGFIFGQFRFFWEFEKKMFYSIFRRKSRSWPTCLNPSIFRIFETIQPWISKITCIEVYKRFYFNLRW